MSGVHERRLGRSVAFLAACLSFSVSAADPEDARDSRLIATGGATQLEGAAGGGIVPWAVISGYAGEGAAGGTVHITRVDLDDYALTTVGAAFALDNRWEFSVVRQDFDLGTLGVLLNLEGASLRQNVFGVKYRAAGDLLYGRVPQIALGLQYKQQLDFAVPAVAGARDDSGVDLYASVSRVFLGAAAGRNLLLNGTLRYTEANQMGLLGFGGDRGEHALVFEGSAAVLLDRQVAVGYEYRQKPDNLSFAAEDDWQDLFVAYFPSRRFALTAAYADLGSIGGLDGQRGLFLSFQGSF